MKLLELYRQMRRARRFELAVADLWRRGRISGEMHAGTGEEAVAAGVVTHLDDRDGLALTHRCTPALVVRGVPLVPLLRELLGRADGIGGGRGGHMHVFDRARRVATSGIVGASVPTAAGFALAAQRLRRGAVGVAFAGDGAMNQGMLLESLNLAAVWSLPLLVVGVDNGWATTTRAGSVTSGDVLDRVRAFGWAVERASGLDVTEIHDAAGALLRRCRRGKGPAFLATTCPRIDGHFLGDPLLDQARHLTGEAAQDMLGRVMASALHAGGGGPFTRARSMARMMGTMAQARVGPSMGSRHDPLQVAERALGAVGDERARIEAEVDAEIAEAVEAALGEEVAHA